MNAPAVARPALRTLPALATVLLLALPTGRWTLGGGQVAVADLASAVLVGVCAALMARGPRPRPRRAAAVLAAPAVAFAAATMASGDPAASLTGFLRFLQVFVLVPLAVLLMLRDRRDFRLVALAVVALAAAQGAVGVVQYATGTGASYLGQNVRAVGTFGPFNVMGMATVVSYGLIAALGLGLAPPRSAPRWWRPVLLGCAALFALPLAFSFSRGAWLATAAAVLAVLLPVAFRLAPRTLLALLAGGALLVGGAAFGSGMVGDRLGSIGEVTGTPDQSVVDRYAMWDVALAMWRAEPWTGTGPKGFAAHRDSHASLGLSAGSDTGGAGQEFRRQELTSPHNMYLLVLSEQGLIGATALIGSWAALLAGCLVRLRRSRSPDVGLVATGLLVWQAVNFLYADIGGPHTVLTAVVFGLAAWWAFAPGARRESP
ncbi:O-antigen ligase family protein [Streptomyces litchfieldiae]|uniref:O-antigen ligase family protein n=1 Tax=Streptomyces litchfieldiae TaxID=3075543 RepID=A0ABU2MKH5_9ACTN|nr:O-antigen ligase family protein [Streptomyces sp. DSM 44938]MDT0342112.1 O-antigen ligase family protein [Streptomyces sp. DSM 44938]